MDITEVQLSMWVAQMQNTERITWEKALRVVSGAEVFARLGQEGMLQSMRRDLIDIALVGGKIMGKPRSTPAAAGNGKSIRWCNYKLTDAQKKQFDAWSPEDDEVAGLVVQMVFEGYRFSLSYDTYKSAMQVSCTAPAEPNENAGKGFSTFAHSWEKVWALCVFKHYSLFGEKWPESVAPPPSEDYG